MGPGAWSLTLILLSLASGSSSLAAAADPCRKQDTSKEEEEEDGESSSCRCRTSNGEQSALIVSGRIFSSESFCRVPLTDEQVSVYLGCVNSSRFEAEPFARWKTGKDGAFEASAPFLPGTRFTKMELCVAERRGCRTLTLKTPGQRFTRRSRSESRTGRIGNRAKVDLCLGERRRRGFGWDEEDVSWLKRQSSGNSGRSEDAQWANHVALGKDFVKNKKTKKMMKRLWEGADEEIGWFKRRSPVGVDSPPAPPGENDGKRSRQFLSDDRQVPMEDYYPDDRHSVIPVTGHSDERMTLTNEAFQSLVVRGRSRHLPTR